MAVMQKVCKTAELSLHLKQTHDFKMKAGKHNFPVVSFTSDIKEKLKF